MYAKFSKRKSLKNGSSIYGVFTRDYRYNATNCQILITVPQSLRILLLSPRNAEWASRIRSVILDHSLMTLVNSSYHVT